MKEKDLPLDNNPQSLEELTDQANKILDLLEKEKDLSNSVENYQELLNDKSLQKEFNKGGSDMSNMLKKQLNSQIDSWAIRFCYHQFQQQLKTVFSTNSKIISVGFGADATHTSGTKRFITKLDNTLKRAFQFEKYIEMDKQLIKDFADKFSIKTRLIDKIKQKFN